MTYERERAMREQEDTEAMIRMRVATQPDNRFYREVQVFDLLESLSEFFNRWAPKDSEQRLRFSADFNEATNRIYADAQIELLKRMTAVVQDGKPRLKTPE